VSIAAVQHIRRMRGGSQSHLMLCEDNQFYVVKCCNNPQHSRVLVNDYLASRLARSVGLPVPTVEVVEVSEWLIEHTPELHVQLAHETVRCQPGLQFGSKYAVHPLQGTVFDYLPCELLATRVRNLEAFAGILAFDKWTGNADGRQVAFWKHSRDRKYTACFIDQGYCFNAGEWTFPDYPLRGVYARNEVYEAISGWHSFEPWLSRIESAKEDKVWGIVDDIPPQWYSPDNAELEKLVRTLLLRRKHVRELIEAFRKSPRRPFPRWTFTRRGVVRKS